MELNELFDIEKMSDDTGISIAAIKEVLNIPLETNCNAKSIFEAQKDFRNAPNFSENKLASFKIWLSLIKNTHDARKAYKCVVKDSIYEVLAYQTWHKLSLEEVSGIVTMAEAKNAYRNAPPFSHAKFLALQKWQQFSLIEISKIITLMDAKKAHKNAPAKSKSKILAFKKIIELTSSILEIKLIYKRLPKDSNLRPAVLHRWHVLSMEEINSAINFSDLKRACDNAPINSEVKNVAIKKLALHFGYKPD